MIGAASI